MKRLLYISALLCLLAACSSEQQPDQPRDAGALVLGSISRQLASTTTLTTRNAVDPDLAVEILASDGNVYRGYQYAAGEALPDKFSLIPGNYTVHAYTENANTWATENDGRGSAVYEIRQDFTIQKDWVTYLDVLVPMTNYGVTYSVPENFDQWFPTCQFTVTSNSRTCPLAPAQAAYFDPESTAGFSFTLHLVNTDGEVYDLEPQTYENPKAGLLYNVTYTFASDDDPTKLKIGISYDDHYEELVSEIILY